MTAYSFLASSVLLAGLWLVGSRSRWGFACTIVGELGWVLISVNRGMYDLAALCLVFAAVAGRNFAKWSAEQRGGGS